MIIYLLNIRIYLIRCCSFFLVSLYIISLTYISIPNVSAIREGPLSNIVSIVKPASCKISINPLEISSSSNLSSFFLFTVSTISIDNDENGGEDSDNCKVESFTTIMDLLFLASYISELLLLLLLFSSFTASNHIDNIIYNPLFIKFRF